MRHCKKLFILVVVACISLISLPSHVLAQSATVNAPSQVALFSSGNNAEIQIEATEIGSFDTYDARGIALSSTYAYVADLYGGLRIIDISNPANPTEHRI